MTRRHLLTMLSAIGLAPKVAAAQAQPEKPRIEPLQLSDAEWKQRLTPAQYSVLRKEGTEPPGQQPAERREAQGHAFTAPVATCRCSRRR